MTIDEPDFEELLPRLSVPAEVHDPGLSRRRFLHGVLAASAVAGIGSARTAHAATAAAQAHPHVAGLVPSQVQPGEGILVTITLGGGNDGLNTLVPVDQGRYYDLRPHLAIPASQAIPIAPGRSLHPALTRTAGHFQAGRVAIVQGVGDPGSDLSHFNCMARIMAGHAGSERLTGWLGRYLDGLPGATGGMRGLNLGSAVPLHLVGRNATITSASPAAERWGTTTEAWEQPLMDLVASYAGQPTGRGPWADQLAAAGSGSIHVARQIGPALGGGLPSEPFAQQMTAAARLVNADLGVRVINTTLGGWDTHAGQAWQHNNLLDQLDRGLDLLWSTTSSPWREQLAVLVFSEFGRRVERNGSNGTDHGTASNMLLMGHGVRGGLHGQHPDLTRLDSRGNLQSHVDFRQVYASVLGQHLRADPREILGHEYPQLPLFR